MLSFIGFWPHPHPFSIEDGEGRLLVIFINAMNNIKALIDIRVSAPLCRAELDGEGLGVRKLFKLFFLYPIKLSLRDTI